MMMRKVRTPQLNNGTLGNQGERKLMDSATEKNRLFSVIYSYITD